MIYPIFEYIFLLYVLLGYIQIRNDYENNECGKNVYNSAAILLWVKVAFIAWFRMIFVCTVTQKPIPFLRTELSPVVAHTLGFFGMQVALILVAFENVSYLIYKEKSMWGMTAAITKIASIVYLTLVLLVTVLKISWASSIFISGTPWFGEPWPHIFDRTWLLLVAVMPIFFAAHGMRTEPDMVISIVNQPREP